MACVSTSGFSEPAPFGVMVLTVRSVYGAPVAGFIEHAWLVSFPMSTTFNILISFPGSLARPRSTGPSSSRHATGVRTGEDDLRSKYRSRRGGALRPQSVSYTHLRAHETV